MIKNNEKLTNAEKLGLIGTYNPYYKEDKYISKRSTSFLDHIDIDDNDEQFIETFKILEFERIFKDNIIEFLNKMISKIKNISNFGTILELINIKKLSKVDYFLAQLKDKYELVINKQIKSLSGKEKDVFVKIIAKFVDLIYIHEKNCDFIENKISKLDKMIRTLIYNELLRRCRGDEYKIMKELIYNKYFIKLENIDNIINFIYSLTIKDKKVFLEELMKKCQFSKEEYYLNNENEKIAILYELYYKGIIIKTEDYDFFRDIEKILKEIYKDLEGEIIISKLEEFLMKNEKEQVIKRLILIKIISEDFNPEEFYDGIRRKMKEINYNIQQLRFIKDCLLKFFSEKFNSEIREISKIIKDILEKNVNNYQSEKTQDTINKLKKLEIYTEKIQEVKDFLFFKVLYDEAKGDDEEKRFHNALNKLKEIVNLFKRKYSIREIYDNNKEIFDKIKEMLSNDESKADIFIGQMRDYFNITKEDELIDLNLIFKSKIYEIDIKSIIFFFENLNVDKNKDMWNKKFSSEYQRLSEMKLTDLKNNLRKLKEDNIYDYEKRNENYKFFTCLYNKKEAIDFLLSKTYRDISALYNKIDPTNSAITIMNLKDTEDCIRIFNEFKNIYHNFEILDLIKNSLTKNQISKFEMFSKNYSSIIELERSDNCLKNKNDNKL